MLCVFYCGFRFGWLAWVFREYRGHEIGSCHVGYSFWGLDCSLTVKYPNKQALVKMCCRFAMYLHSSFSHSLCLLDLIVILYFVDSSPFFPFAPSFPLTRTPSVLFPSFILIDFYFIYRFWYNVKTRKRVFWWELRSKLSVKTLVYFFSAFCVKNLENIRRSFKTLKTTALSAFIQHSGTSYLSHPMKQSQRWKIESI